MAKILFDTQILSAPQYPLELVPQECFYFFDEQAQQRNFFFANVGGAGWRSGAVDASGAVIGLPLGAKLTWYSYVENLFYHTVIMFPLDIIQQELFRKLSLDTDVRLFQQKYQCIQFAIAPKGFVAVRLGWAEITEIAQSQAEVANLSWNYFAAVNRFNGDALTQEKYLKPLIKFYELESIIKQYKENTFPINRWKNYSTQLFPWKFVTDIDITGYSEFLINGNKRFTLYKNHNTSIVKQAVPALYRLYFKENNKRFKAIINFSQFNTRINERINDDIKIFELFKKFFTSSNHPSTLFVTKKDDKFTAILTNGQLKQDIPIVEQTIVEIHANEHLWFK